MKKNTYLERYAYPEKLISAEPNNRLSIIVTIPAYDEPETQKAIISLASCSLPQESAVEVLVLINHPENDNDELIKRSERSYHQLQEFARHYSEDNFQVHVLIKAIPPKQAGVGRARKILMDEAVRRFERVNNKHGVITAFDADCTCSSNYFLEIENYFKINPQASGCSIYFEHPGNSAGFNDEIVHAALQYELHLRCYIDALRWCGIPHAFQTTGSSMAVNHLAYQRQGGMNNRKAGEDFYFLHRIIREGNYGDLTSTTVIPSPRKSERVPFGTGKAVIKRLETGRQLTYNTQSYILLREFIHKVDELYDTSEEGLKKFLSSLPTEVHDFLLNINFEKELHRIISHSSSPPLFKKHFFQWFDGFKVMKYLHFLRERGFNDLPVENAANEIREWLSADGKFEGDILTWYRTYDKNQPAYLQY